MFAEQTREDQMLTRRALLPGLVVAPAIIQSGLTMPISSRLLQPHPLPLAERVMLLDDFVCGFSSVFQNRAGMTNFSARLQKLDLPVSAKAAYGDLFRLPEPDTPRVNVPAWTMGVQAAETVQGLLADNLGGRVRWTPGPRPLPRAVSIGSSTGVALWFIPPRPGDTWRGSVAWTLET
jgi:hypothetical protein